VPDARPLNSVEGRTAVGSDSCLFVHESRSFLRPDANRCAHAVHYRKHAEDARSAGAFPGVPP
jgi:hypothetical protein